MKEFLEVNDLILCRVDIENENTAWYQDLDFQVAKDYVVNRDGKTYLKGKVAEIDQGSAMVLLDTGVKQVEIWVLQHFRWNVRADMSEDVIFLGKGEGICPRK